MAALSQAYVCLLLCLGMVVLCHAVRPIANHAMSERMWEDNGLWLTPPVSPVGSWHHGVPPYAGGSGAGSGYPYPPDNNGGAGASDYSYPYNGGGSVRNYGGCSGCGAPGSGCNYGCGCPPYESLIKHSGNGLSADRGSHIAEKKDAEGGHSP